MTRRPATRPPIPPVLVREVSRFRAGEGLEWLARLPALLAELSERWSLRLGEPFAYPSLSFVAPAVREDGTAVVLKVGFIGDELPCEIEALRLFGGRGIAHLFEADAEQGALLLERLEPGTALAETEDDEVATSVAAAVMRTLWRPAPAEHAFPSVARWAGGLKRLRERFEGGTGPLPPALVERAEGLMADLLASAGPPMLLHGDLQHYNILRAGREPWLAIDPKGVVGDPAYEPNALLRNRFEDAPDPARLLARRIDQLSAEVGLERERVRAWGIAGAVLSAWWSVEDTGEGWESAIRCAEIIASRP